jgi:hypothetical protein
MQQPSHAQPVGVSKNPPTRQSEGFQGALVMVAPLSPRRLLLARPPENLPGWLDRGRSSDYHSRRDCAGISPDLLRD